jgi:hypothetical protein
LGSLGSSWLYELGKVKWGDSGAVNDIGRPPPPPDTTLAPGIFR